MNKYYLIINNVNDKFWNITDTIETDESGFNASQYYQCSAELVSYVKEKLNEQLYLKVDFTKLGFDGAHITKYDIILNDMSLDNIKTKYINSAFSTLNNAWTVTTNIDMFLFIMANNKLIEAGFTVTSDNIDEVAEKIIILNNENILKLFNTFYSLYSKFNDINTEYARYMTYTDKISNVSTVNDIESIVY